MEEELIDTDIEIADMEVDIDRYILTYRVVGLRDPIYAIRLALLKARHGRISTQQMETKWRLASIKERIEANGLECDSDCINRR